MNGAEPGWRVECSSAANPEILKGGPGNGAARFFILVPSFVRHDPHDQCGAATPPSPSRRSSRMRRIQVAAFCFSRLRRPITGSQSGTSDGALGGLARWRHRPSESTRPRLVHSGRSPHQPDFQRLLPPRRKRTLSSRGSCHGRWSGESRRPRSPWRRSRRSAGNRSRRARSMGWSPKLTTSTTMHFGLARNPRTERLAFRGSSRSSPRSRLATRTRSEVGGLFHFSE